MKHHRQYPSSPLPLIDPEASTPDLSDAEESNNERDKQKIVNNEDDIHECYAFSSLVAKALCKIEKNRRHECMHEIMHFIMQNCEKE